MIPVITISNDCGDNLRAAAKGISSLADEELLIAAEELQFHLSSELRTQLRTFRRWGSAKGGLLIRRVPVDEPLPPTPNFPGASHREPPIARVMALLFAQSCGEVISYAQEKSGRLVQNVFPTRGNESEWSSESSRALLPFHTETAFHPYMPSKVLLFCLKADREGVAETLLASATSLTAGLSPVEIGMMLNNEYETGIDYSFVGITGRRGGGMMTRLLHGTQTDPLIRIDPGLMTSPEPEAMVLLGNLEKKAHNVATSLRLVSGDLLIIDNHRAMHARTEFIPHYDGTDRWLLRSYIADELTSSVENRSFQSRIIATEF